MAGRLYDTAAWRRARSAKLARDPLCEQCLLRSKVVQATCVDHVTALADGGAAFDPGNLRSLCTSCHSEKTVKLDRGFGRARDPGATMKGTRNDGLPVDPSHPWHCDG